MRQFLISLLIFYWKFGWTKAISKADIVDRSLQFRETSLNHDDFANQHPEVDLTSLGIITQKDPTQGSQIEGDIFSKNRRKFSDSASYIARSSIRDPNRRWPSNEIPYAISSQYGPYARAIIARAMQVFHDQTCIRFVPRDKSRHDDYALLMPDEGCFSEVGRAGGRQLVSLTEECLQHGVVVHELNHVVGFFHEQSRSDRDDYVSILWQNIRKGAEDQFEMFGQAAITHLNEPYDYNSIMHYASDAFGDGLQTILALKEGGENMGQRQSLSNIDLKKINKMYRCSSTRRPKPIDLSKSVDPEPETIRIPDTEIIPNQPIDAVIETSSSTSVLFNGCYDYDFNCYILAQNGLCEFDPLIQQRCPRSCQMCPTTMKSPAPMTSCVDKNPHCQVWKAQGFCGNPHFSGQCPRSCGLCRGDNGGSPVEKKDKAIQVRQEDIQQMECKNDGGWLTCKLAWLFDQCDEPEKANKCRKSCDKC